MDLQAEGDATNSAPAQQRDVAEPYTMLFAKQVRNYICARPKTDIPSQCNQLGWGLRMGVVIIIIIPEIKARKPNTKNSNNIDDNINSRSI